MIAPRRDAFRARLPAHLNLMALLESARKELFVDPGVLGVGVGLRRRNGALVDEAVIIVYVNEKLSAPTHPVPRAIEGLPTDVVVPFARADDRVDPDSPLGRQLHADMMFIDWGRVHERALRTRGQAHAAH